MEEHRDLLAKANQQIEMNNQEMNRLKEVSMSNNKNKKSGSFEDDEEEEDERQMREIVEQFEVG